MRIAVGTDHAGLPLKRIVVAWLEAHDYEVVDFGVNAPDRVDYPDFVAPAAQAVAAGDCRFGLVFGGSGTGEPSMLGALSRAIPESERIIVIEDTSELRLHQQHCLYLESQPSNRKSQMALTIRELFRSSLRMRPDRIIVGEVRGGEALDLIQSMISGHEGSLSTVHASSAIDALIRLETLSLMSEIEIPVYVARSQVASAIDIVVQLTRSNETGRRRISSISETLRLSADQQYESRELYHLKPAKVKNGKAQNDLVKSSLADGVQLSLVESGTLPTFKSEPFVNGMNARIKHSAGLWESA